MLVLQIRDLLVCVHMVKICGNDVADCRIVMVRDTKAMMKWRRVLYDVAHRMQWPATMGKWPWLVCIGLRCSCVL